MPNVTFKTKVHKTVSGAPFIRIPNLTRAHCNMHEFRTHPKFGSVSNSNLFDGLLTGALRLQYGLTDRLMLDEDLPEGITVDDSGFLAVVTINLEYHR